MRKIFLTLLAIILFPYEVGAVHEVIDARCTNSLKTKLRNEGQDIVYRLSKDFNGDNVTYTAYFYNMTENISLYGLNGKLYYDAMVPNLKPGEKVMLNFYASNKTYCDGYKILTKVINVPNYNPYYGTELCKDNESFHLCGEYINVNLGEEQFKNELNKYKESLNKEEEIEEEEIINQEPSLGIMDYLFNYGYYIICGIAIVSSIALIIIFINKRKNGGIL